MTATEPEKSGGGAERPLPRPDRPGGFRASAEVDHEHADEYTAAYTIQRMCTRPYPPYGLDHG
ncbi:hypothetical protein CLV72_101754 [Allonocardiopsis opalescens]|uniref:Uncharacterized protein n=1 Tax=Allonocardiopsis opalescens TaxID=1144618 RepID=A0A2T0QE77_9ACTN|nr:hypothetical protein CLV72_101754 [Allonocardiopsis opalescens]